MSTPLTLIVTLIARPGQAAAVEAALRLLIPSSQAEAGCLQYNLHRHRDNPQRFSMIEQWQDRAALDAHERSAHFLSFGRTCAGLLEQVEHQPMHRIL
ncbi:putative quinol monooxygenase [Pseudomonas sp. MBLB4136]|uniref:putative quinol monooxygenase n=1 Tax=Pseudomonas sp. MBLB4136 TaxID=3451558 RepID=UPI003F74ECCD